MIVCRMLGRGVFYDLYLFPPFISRAWKKRSCPAMEKPDFGDRLLGLNSTTHYLCDPGKVDDPLCALFFPTVRDKHAPELMEFLENEKGSYEVFSMMSGTSEGVTVEQ